jgi:hypothetical protein
VTDKSIIIGSDKYIAFVHGHPLKLTPVEFRLFDLLSQR